jgi:uncharacterized protein (TIGR01777 family)
MAKKLVIAGGNGYLGAVLTSYFSKEGWEVFILSRKGAEKNDTARVVPWDGRTLGEWIHCLEGADLLINLCGRNVNCRYIRANREAILRSRLEPTQVLGEAIRQLENPPRLWLNASSATIYRHAEDGPQDERRGEIGRGFSVEVCRQWEACLMVQETPSTRKVALRIGIVFGGEKSILPRLVNLARLGLGGKQGSGLQRVSWIHESDLARAIEFIAQQDAPAAVYNLTAPQAVTNQELMGIVRKAYGVPFGLSSPQWLLELGAVLIRTET